jgi:DNA-binding MarR family transcriptional regulator
VTATKAVTQDVQELAEELGGFAQRLQELLRRELLSAECTITQARALATLKREGPKRLTDLATLQHVSQPSMSMLVARMESRGLVQRQAEPNLPRTTRIAITPTGRALLDDLVARRAYVIRWRLEQLSDSERADLMTALPALSRLAGPPLDHGTN